MEQSPDSGAARILGVDAGSRSLAEADHLLATVVSGLGLAGDPVAATHFVRVGTPHVAVSVEVPDGVAVDAAAVASAAGSACGVAWGEVRQGPAELVEGALAAVAAHGGSGRLVRFPGVGALTGTVTVAEILERTAISEVSVLMGSTAESEVEVVTRDHVRPEWREGAVVLVVQAAAGGRLTPFEVPNPTPCCADH